MLIYLLIFILSVYTHTFFFSAKIPFSFSNCKLTTFRTILSITKHSEHHFLHCAISCRECSPLKTKKIQYKPQLAYQTENFHSNLFRFVWKSSCVNTLHEKNVLTSTDYAAYNNHFNREKKRLFHFIINIITHL
jgi:hypothetical protein